MDNLLRSSSIFLYILLISGPAFSLKCYHCISPTNSSCPYNETGDERYVIIDCKKTWDDTDLIADFIPSRIKDNMTENIVTSEETSVSKDENKVMVCIKYLFYVEEWAHFQSQGVETKKRMIDPRIQYGCGMTYRNKSDECISRRKIGLRQSQCTCSTDLCNGSRRSVIISFISLSLASMFTALSNFYFTLI